MLHIWFYDGTGRVRDYLRTEPPVKEQPRPGEARVSGPELPDGHEPTWYRWNGTAIVLRPKAEYDPRGAERDAITAGIEKAVLTDETKNLLKRVLALIQEAR